MKVGISSIERGDGDGAQTRVGALDAGARPRDILGDEARRGRCGGESGHKGWVPPHRLRTRLQQRTGGRAIEMFKDLVRRRTKYQI